jgi:hypothetical protein
MSSSEADSSTASNSKMLSELLAPILVFQAAFWGRNPSRWGGAEDSQRKVKKTLAQILA